MKKTKLFISAIMLTLLFTGCNSNPSGPSYTDEILNNPDWEITNKSAIHFDTSNGVYTINAKENGCGFKTTITSAEPKTVNFKIKTHILDQYDGYMQFLIDDEIIGQYTGAYSIWQNEQIDIGAGSHTFEWKHYDTNPGTYSNFAANKQADPYIALKEIKFTDQSNAIKSINKDSNNAVISKMWVASGFYSEVVDKDPVYASWPQYGKALVDTHGKVLKLATYKLEDGNKCCGNSTMTIKEIEVSEDSTLSFDYKCDLLDWTDENNVYHKNYLKVYVDDNTTPAVEGSGFKQIWQNASINLPQGTHTVKFVSGTDDFYFGYDITNATYIDNITLVPNTIASVDIYPKGLQETYVNGNAIKFNAKALRSDDSVISDKIVSWSSTGGSIDSDGLFTPGSAEGTFTVTATIDGLSASNQTIKIHSSNYLSDPVTINNQTFTGEISEESGILFSKTNNITLEAPSPKYTKFTANGFFVLKGTTTNDKSVRVFIRKQGPGALTSDNQYNPDYRYQASIIIPPGDFEQRIWLRFGDGLYDVEFAEADATFNENYDQYEGALTGWNVQFSEGSVIRCEVTNKTGLNWSSDDCEYLMPSDNCQCDDLLISNAFNAVMAELPENASLGQKLQALYDWEAHTSHYDYVSFSNGQSTPKRKKQDAVHVLKYGMAVCEGYADLYTAFARLAGVKATFQYSRNLNHNWTEVYYDGKWRMIDVTWDDTTNEGSVDKKPTSENYSYFLIDPNDASHIKTNSGGSDRITVYSRTAFTETQQ